MKSDGDEGGVAAVIRAAVAARGAIPFSRFMELALYAPGVGYYQREECVVGRRGDFFTSVSVGPVLGFLLAWRFAGWCRECPTVNLVEAAAHDGQLADDVLSALREHHPDVLARVRYWIVEPFPSRESAQRGRLAPWGERIRWVAALGELPAPMPGVIFANELLDAFPVRRLGWDGPARGWFEWGVTLSDAGAPAWCRLPLEPAVDLEVPDGLAAVIPDGFVVEMSPAAEAWWAEAARILAPGEGWLATLDYGFDRETPIRPERPQGSLRAYHRHRLEPDLLARPGEQDLTAHVDFGRIRAAGERAGLATEALLPQGRWLGTAAAEVFAAGGAAAEWLQGRARGLQTLMDPRHLGQAFTALVQRRGIGTTGLP